MFRRFEGVQSSRLKYCTPKLATCHTKQKVTDFHIDQSLGIMKKKTKIHKDFKKMQLELLVTDVSFNIFFSQILMLNIELLSHSKNNERTKQLDFPLFIG